MTYWMEVARWLLVGTALGALAGQMVRPLVTRRRQRQQEQGRSVAR